ncbi:hypothetical protein ACTFIU_011369 [Dictyostelium citrinum]
MKYLIEVIGETFLSISDPIDHRHWFLSKEQHAYEFIFMNLFYLVVIFIGINLNKKREHENQRKSKPTTEKDYPSLLNKIVAIILAINVFLNLIYKCLRGWRVVFFMLQPCHIVSTIYCYCLLTNNYQFGRKVFKISIYYILVTIAALVAPDLADLTLPFECYNFFIQHYALLIAPFLLQAYRYNIEFELPYALISQGLFGISHFFVFEIFSFISGTNINYMLFPPPLGEFSYLTQESYRIGIAFILFILALGIGRLVILIGSKIRSSLLVKNKSK